MDNMSPSSDSVNPPTPVHNLSETESVTVTKAVISDIISNMTDCLDVMDDSDILEFISGVADNLETLVFTYRSGMLFKSESESDMDFCN